jgi:hypothetical protein
MRKLLVVVLVLALAAGFAGVAVAQVPACSDGIDNDGDGLVDFPNDPGCDSPMDFHEEPVNLPPRGDSCRASALRVTGKGPLSFLGTIEPFVANDPKAPCKAEEGGLVSDAFIPLGKGGVAVSVLDAETTDAVVGSEASVALVIVANPVDGKPLLAAAVLFSQAQANCESTGEIFSGFSEVLAVQIGKNLIEVPPGHTDIPLGPLGTVHLNETLNPTPLEQVQRALWVDTPLVEVVAGESAVDCTPRESAP